MSMKNKLTDREVQFVEETLHKLDYERGMYRPLSDAELSELTPEMREAVLIARNRARVLEHDE